MIDFATVARLEELRQADGLAKTAPEHRRLAGGCVGRGVPGTWVNYAVGMGLDGPVQDSDIDEMVQFFEEKKIVSRIELCPMADLSLARGLAQRAFVLSNWENILYRELDPAALARPILTPPDSLTFRVIDPNDAAELREYSHVSMSGFFPPGTQPSEADFEVAARWARQPRVLCVAGIMDGKMVGAGAASLSPQVVNLGGLSVLPEFRRRGIQQALIAERLNLAAARGVTLATIGSRPGAATERNVRRMGFQLAYVKAVLVRPGPGLIPNVE
jgi:GNAT superfamily N-acetyltransferase